MFVFIYIYIFILCWTIVYISGIEQSDSVIHMHVAILSLNAFILFLFGYAGLSGKHAGP